MSFVNLLQGLVLKTVRDYNATVVQQQSRVKEFCTSGWPKKHLVEAELLPYWKIRNSLSLHNMEQTSSED